MEIFFNYLLKGIFLPPGGFVLLFFIGLVLLRKKRKMATALLSITLVTFYLVSTPVFSTYLIGQLEAYPALTENIIKTKTADAIVILGAGRYEDAPEYSGDTISEPGLVRVRYGAFLHKLTGLPIITTGGSGFAKKEALSEAQLMKQSLQEDFGLSNILTEDESLNTADNARLTKLVLDKHNFKRVYLVTHAWHMPRSVAVFKANGVDVIPAPTGFEKTGTPGDDLLDWLPSSLGNTRWALHEWIGLLWYKLRY
ncbi:MAG: YdcF family protein [Gammaproteobacteria bacterium]|nr:YdcF family protein [Gammaproteobacteria bacterium]